jgi:hypothetical protein
MGTLAGGTWRTGVVGSVAITRVLSGFLFGIKPLDR